MTDGSNPSRLGANDVRKAVLTTHRGGYDQAEVDAFLQEVADELDRPVERRTITAQSVGEQVFGSVALRQGYTEQEVDALLDSVVERLKADELAAAAQAAARREPGPADLAEPDAPPGPPASASPPAGPASLPSLDRPDVPEEPDGPGEPTAVGDFAGPSDSGAPDQSEQPVRPAAAVPAPSQSTSWFRRVTDQLRHRGH
jgi:DivIVA domain-containing protein